MSIEKLISITMLPYNVCLVGCFGWALLSLSGPAAAEPAAANTKPKPTEWEYTGKVCACKTEVKSLSEFVTTTTNPDITPDMFKPVIRFMDVIPGKPLHVNYMDKGSLRVSVKANPPVNYVIWSFDANDTRKYAEKIKEYTSRIDNELISTATLDYTVSGTFSAMASNIVGFTILSYFVIVHYPPRLKVLGFPNKNTTITCTSRAYDLPTIYWNFHQWDGRVVNLTGLATEEDLHVDLRKSELTFPGKKSGTVECMPVNQKGLYKGRAALYFELEELAGNCNECDECAFEREPWYRRPQEP